MSDGGSNPPTRTITVTPETVSQGKTEKSTMNQQTIDNDEYDITNYIKPDHVIPKVLVTEKTDRAVIIGPGGVKTFQKKDEHGQPVGAPDEKLYVEVQFPSGRTYEYRMGPQQAEKLAVKLGNNRREWVGAILMFTPEEKATMKWCSAVVVEVPKPSAEASK